MLFRMSMKTFNLDDYFCDLLEALEDDMHAASEAQVVRTALQELADKRGVSIPARKRK